MSSSSRVLVASAVSTSRRPGPAQPGVEHERGDDGVGARVVEVVGEGEQRVGQRLADAQPVDQQVERRAQDRRRRLDAGRDRLLEADRAGDGVAQGLGPDREALQAQDRQPLLAARPGDAVPVGDEQADADGRDRPAGEQQHDDADDERRPAAADRSAPPPRTARRHRLGVPGSRQRHAAHARGRAAAGRRRTTAPAEDGRQQRRSRRPPAADGRLPAGGDEVVDALDRARAPRPCRPGPGRRPRWTAPGRRRRSPRARSRRRGSGRRPRRRCCACAGRPRSRSRRR